MPTALNLKQQRSCIHSRLADPAMPDTTPFVVSWTFKCPNDGPISQNGEHRLHSPKTVDPRLPISICGISGHHFDDFGGPGSPLTYTHHCLPIGHKYPKPESKRSQYVPFRFKYHRPRPKKQQSASHVHLPALWLLVNGLEGEILQHDVSDVGSSQIDLS